MNGGNKAGYLKVIYPKFLEVGKRSEVMHGTSAELFGAKLLNRFHADPKSLDKRKEAKFVRFFEWPGPNLVFLLPVGEGCVVGCEGVVKMETVAIYHE
jgi:hypothetical protein